MNAIHTQLAERIRDEVETLEQVVDRALIAWEKAQDAPGEQAYVDSVALNLHGIYAGVERLFELVARHVDGELPDGATWHRDLLHQMTHDVADVRPAVISSETAEDWTNCEDLGISCETYTETIKKFAQRPVLGPISAPGTGARAII